MQRHPGQRRTHALLLSHAPENAGVLRAARTGSRLQPAPFSPSCVALSRPPSPRLHRWIPGTVAEVETHRGLKRLVPDRNPGAGRRDLAAGWARDAVAAALPDTGATLV